MTEWSQLVLTPCDTPRRGFGGILEASWRNLVGALRPVEERDMAGPESRAWFHVRRRFFDGEYGLIRAIEVLRLRDAEGSQLREDLVRTAEAVPHVAKAEWVHVDFGSKGSNEFLSFLQKLSYLRVVERIVVSHDLGEITNHPYGECPYCQQAYAQMRSPGMPWSEALAPWFRIMDEMPMPADLSHEYAHWFGHIMSRWWVDA